MGGGAVSSSRGVAGAIVSISSEGCTAREIFAMGEQAILEKILLFS